MARKQRNSVEYFPHDARASEGDTLTIIESQFGNDGYAFWFKLLEKLASTDGHTIDCNDSTKWQLLCAKAHSTPEKAKTIVETLAALNAIDKDLWQSRIIWCQNLVDNVADVYRNRRRDIPQKPITTPIITIPTSKNSITTPDNTQSKVKENKEERPPIVPQGTVVLPDWIKKEDWAAFKEMRLKIRAPLTDSAAKRILNQLARFRAAGDDIGEVLNQSIMCSYRGVFPLKGDNNGQFKKNRGNRGNLRSLPQSYPSPDDIRRTAADDTGGEAQRQ